MEMAINDSISNVVVSNTAGHYVNGQWVTGDYHWPDKTWWWPYKPYEDTTFKWINLPTTVYMYQITCPKCSTMNWCELDKVKSCIKCGHRMKAVFATSDYTEIPVKA
jgi:hypothetical protein